MKKITLLFLAFTVCVFTVNAQYVFPPIAGPTNVVAGTPVTIDLNDAANAAGVTAGQYGSFTITADWEAGGGGPWSTEAEMQITTTAGVVDVDPPTAGAGANGDATTLTFSAGLTDIYDPSVDGTLSITLGQSFGGSDANWSNISVTLEPFVAPPLPTIAGTFNISGCFDSDTYTAAYDASVTGIVWVEVVYDGNCSALIADTEGTDFDTEIGLYDASGFLIGSDDDGGTGTLSLFSAPGLAAGTYYIAAGRYNVTFGSGFAVTTSNPTQTGSLSITASTPPPPPPTTVATLTLAGCGALDTYNNAVFDAAVDGVVWIQLDYDGACFAGTFDTEGTDFDTEIGLYDSNGLRIGNDDDGGTGTLSSFTEAGLAAGTYYIAAGGYNMIFNATDYDVTTTSTLTGNLVVNASTPVIPPPPTTVATLTLAGCDGLDTYNNAVFDAAVDGVVWIQLDYDGACFEATVDTEGSDIDTEIGLYDSNGLRIGNNDDGGTGTLSSFTEAGLAAGTYYIAAGGYNIVFNDTDFDATTASGLTGNLVVNASTPTLNTVDFCNLQFPSTGAITTGDNFEAYAQVYEAGVTEPAGQGANIEAWIGYNTTDATATVDFETGWTWVLATYSTDNGNNDEYVAEIGSGRASGTYYYASRFTVDGGPFSYGGINPGGSDGNFWDGVNFVSGQLTVTDPPPPANDVCSGAIDIACDGSESGDTSLINVTDTIGNPSADLWYSYSGPAGDITASLCTSAYDTNMRVFDSCGGTEIATNDDFCNLQSQVTFVADGTTTYYIAVEGYNTSEGAFTLDITCAAATPPPANDLCANAEALALTVTSNGTTVGATQTPGEEQPTCDTFGSIADVWYSINIAAASDLSVVTTIAGTSDQANVAVYSACGGLQADQLACSDANGGESLTLPGLASGTYYIRVWSDGSAPRPGAASRIEGEFTITADATLSTNSFDSETAFTFYPNPVKNTLTLNAQNIIEQVAMYNMLGQEVLRATPNTIDSDLDMSNLQTGTYFVKVTIGNVTKTIRVMKQ